MSSLKRTASIAFVSPGVSKAKRPRTMNKSMKGEINVAVRKALDRREELKIKDTTFNVSSTLAGTVVDLSSIAQGTTEATRIGNRISPKYLDIRASVHVADATNVLRVVVFQWHLDDGAVVPTASNILQAGLVTGNWGPWAGYNNDERNAFSVLGDWVWQLNAASSNTSVDFVRRIKRKMRQPEYAGTLLTGTSKIYMLLISDSAAAPNPFMVGVSRLHFGEL